MVSYAGTEGNWGDWNFDNENWGDHIMAGVNGALSYGGTAGQLIGEALRTAAYNISGGAGFDDLEGVNDNQYNWNIFKPDANQMGSAFAKLVPYLFDDGKESEESDKPGAPGPDTQDPYQQVETYLGGLWVGNRSWQDNMAAILNHTFGSMVEEIKKAAEYLAEGDILGLIREGLSREFNETVQGIQKIAAGLGAIGGAISNAWGSILETVGGWFGGDEEQNRDLLASAGVNISPEELEKIKKYEEAKRFKELQEKQREAEASKNYKEAKKILENKDTLTESEFKDFMQTMFQFDKNGLPEEVLQAMKNDPESFEKLFGNTFEFKNGKIQVKLTEDPASFSKFATNISQVFCVSLTLYSQMVANKIEGTPDSFGEFLKQMLEMNLINPQKPARQIKPTQDIIDAFAGKDEFGNSKYKVIGAGVDTGPGYFTDEDGNITAQKDIYNKLMQTARENQFIEMFTIRFKTDNGRHNTDAYNRNGDLYQYDTAGYGFGAPLSRRVNSITIQSWYYIIPNQ